MVNKVEIEKLQRFIDESNRIVFIGGAGVSTKSGVPDFRSKDGLYNQHDIRFEDYEPEYLLSHGCLVDYPDVFLNIIVRRWMQRGRTKYYTSIFGKAGGERETILDFNAEY